MSDILIARQPVFDREFHLASYELLFRSKETIDFQGEYMSAQVIVSALMDIGLDSISNGHPVNINACTNLLRNDISILSALPADKVGIELLETIPVNKETIQACRALKDQGFTPYCLIM